MPASRSLTKLEWALAHIAKGWHVFPCDPNSKEPLQNPDGTFAVGGVRSASSSEEQVRAWWGMWPDANIAGTGFLVIDCDTKAGVNGPTNLAKWCLETGTDLPPTLEFRSQSGGVHKVYEADPGNPSGQCKLADGVDVRAPGKGYILLPGSTIDGRAYTVLHKREIAKAPARVQTASAEREVKVLDECLPPPGGWDSPEALAEAIAYLTGDRVPIAEKGKDGNATTVRVFRELRDRGISHEAALEMFHEHYNPRCLPPWPQSDFDRRRPDLGGYTKAENLVPGVKHPNAHVRRAAMSAISFHAMMLKAGRDDEAATRDMARTVQSFELPPSSGLIFDSDDAPEYPTALVRACDVVAKRWPYLWAGLVREGDVNLSPGFGLVGKGRFWMQLAVATAAGQAELFGLKIRRKLPVVFVSAEDDYAELKRRAAGIAAEMGLDGIPDSLFLLSLVQYSGSMALAKAARRPDGIIEVVEGPFLEPLGKMLEPLGEHLLVLDAATDAADIEDVSKEQVNAFLKRWCRKLCQRVKATVVLIAHPSKAAANDRTFVSTPAWANAVRSVVPGERVTRGKKGWVPDPTSSGPEYMAHFFQAKGNDLDTDAPNLYLRSSKGRVGFTLFHAAEAEDGAEHPGDREQQAIDSRLVKWCEFLLDPVLGIRWEMSNRIGVNAAANHLAEAAAKMDPHELSRWSFDVSEGKPRKRANFYDHLSGQSYKNKASGMIHKWRVTLPGGSCSVGNEKVKCSSMIRHMLVITYNE